MSQDLPSALPTTSYAVLGLLTFGDELTGYELKQRADNTLRFYWVAPAMSQIYSELARLTDHGLVEPTTSDGEGRRTTTYRITAAGPLGAGGLDGREPRRLPGAQALGAAAAADRARGRAGADPRRCSRSTSPSSRSRGTTCARCATRLRAADGPGEAFHYPSVVADWGLDYFAAEARHTRKALDRLSITTDSEEP